MKIRKKFIFYAVLALVATLSISFVSYKQNLDPITFELIAEGFTSPVKLVESPDSTGRLFVVDRTGIVKIISGNETLEEPFLDISNKVVELRTTFDERGLLGFAFHPDFESNGKFYVYYSSPLRNGAPAGFDHTSRISEFSVSKDDLNKANIYSERILLQIDEPQFNHDGGELIFGSDNYLYIAVGDGGNADDLGLGHSEIGNGQDTNTLLGKILRINVNGGVPQDNPFVGKSGRDEIYAYGLRNPFRMSFDDETGRLFVGDVGQNLWEEVHIVEKGKNYGWNIKEGSYCFSHESADESPAECLDVGYNGEELVEPILEYNHSIGLSVIGGFVYRGNSMPEFEGKYIFGDWSDNFVLAGGKIFIAEEKNNSWSITDTIKLNSFLLGFGEDENKELYILTSESVGPVGNSGKVYKIIKK
jgi:glucose/arabinose dehydrogenase